MQTQKKETSGQNLYGILTSTELNDYLQKIDVDNFIRSPSAQQAMLDLMDACHHATAGTGLDAFIIWASQADSLRNKIPDIRQRWNRIAPDHGLTVHHLARELRLHGDLRLEAKLSQYKPRSINMTLRSMIARVREPMDAHRVIDELAKLDSLHPYQINTVLSKLAKKTSQKISILHDLYDNAVQTNVRGGIDWPHYTLTRAGIIKLQPTYENFCHALTKFRIEVQYNLMQDTIDVTYPDMRRSEYHMHNKQSMAEIKSRCAQEGLSIPQQLMREYVDRLACEPGHEYHPVSAWLQSKTWDGLDRWPAFLAQLEVSNLDSDGLRSLFRRYFFKALDALYQEKGVQNSFLLALIGKSGSGKTAFLRSLVPEDNADDWIVFNQAWPYQGRDAFGTWYRMVMTRWLCEITSLTAYDLDFPSHFRPILHANADRYVWHNTQKIEKSKYRRTLFVASIPSASLSNAYKSDDLFLKVGLKRFTQDNNLDMHQFWAQVKHAYDSRH